MVQPQVVGQLLTEHFHDRHLDQGEAEGEERLAEVLAIELQSEDPVEHLAEELELLAEHLVEQGELEGADFDLELGQGHPGLMPTSETASKIKPETSNPISLVSTLPKRHRY